MLFKTTDKFGGPQCHLFLSVTVSKIFIGKRYCIILIIYTAYPVITDGYFMSISAQVFNNSMGSAKGSFDINDPVFVMQQVQQLFFIFIVRQDYFTSINHLL